MDFYYQSAQAFPLVYPPTPTPTNPANSNDDFSSASPSVRSSSSFLESLSQTSPYLEEIINAATSPPHYYKQEGGNSNKRQRTSIERSSANTDFQQPFAAFDGFKFDTATTQANGFGAPITSTAAVVNGMNGTAPMSSLQMDIENDHNQRARSSSEEKELTPAQYRRKAQNRAAQRAFRERKERHVKDLEAKLSSLESTSAEMMSENERLRKELQKVSTENEILRATSSNGSSLPGTLDSDVSVGPPSYSPTDFFSTLLQAHNNKMPSHRITVSPQTGERLLGAGAAWDLIMSDPLFEAGLVDVGDVCERLKGAARCDGQGPCFEEGVIKEAIRASAGSGKDELI